MLCLHYTAIILNIMKINFVSFSVLIIFIFYSCSKSSNADPDIPKPKPEAEPIKISRNSIVHYFNVDDENNLLIYPGNIVEFKGNESQISISRYDSYKKLPVRLMSYETNLGSEQFNKIPTLLDVQRYVGHHLPVIKDSDISPKNYWREILDYNFLKGMLMTAKERERFFPLLKGFKETESSFYCAMNFNIFEVIMEFPDAAELLSVEAEEDIKKHKLPCYYVKSASYGDRVIFYAQSKSKKEDLISVLNKMSDLTPLQEGELKILDQSSLAIFHRTSSKRETMINKAEGRKAILDLYKKTYDIINNSKNKNLYPITFSLHGLNGSGSFQHDLKYEYWGFPIDE